MMNRPVVVLGALLALAGFVLMIAVVTGTVGPADPSPMQVPQVQAPAEDGMPSRVWAIVAGLMLAVGAALVMIGMNRWRQPGRRRI